MTTIQNTTSIYCPSRDNIEMDRLFVGDKRRTLLQLFATSDDNDEKIISEPKNPAVKPTNEFE